MFGYRKNLDNRICSVIEMFGYLKCSFGILITERSVIEVLLYQNACAFSWFAKKILKKRKFLFCLVQQACFNSF